MIDKFLVVLFSMAYLGVEVYQQVKQRRRGGGAPRDRADRGSLIVLYTGIAVGYSTAFTLSFAKVGRLPGDQPLWLFVGAALIVVGLLIRRRAMRTLDELFTFEVEIQGDHRLVETGLYRRIRHPGYLGQLLVFLGPAVALANALGVVAMLVATLVAFGWRIRVEEAALAARFGDAYEAYRRRTSRLVPGIY
jgi:protein-S-isoprenylcysteine O-methyltransferase Ste14